MPNLRFPEFSGEWEKRKLASIGKFFSGGTPTSSNKDYYDGEIPFIRSGEIHSDHTELSISAIGYENSSAKMVSKGDLLLALYGATSGDIAISRMSGAINQAILCIRTTQDHLFLKSVWEKHVKNILNTYLQGGQGNLSADIVKNLFFYFPRIEEQRKIGRLIELIDQRIAIQNRAIEQYESLIKGISSEVIGGKRPNTTLSNCVFCSSSTLKESELIDTGIPTYGAAGISGYTAEALCKSDSILITKDGSGVGSKRYVHGEHSFVGTLCSLTPKDGIYLPYVYYALMTMNLDTYKTGQAIPHIYFKDYGKLQLFCPTYSEQRRLSHGLETLDRKVEFEKNLLLSINEVKKGLLDQLFI